MHLQSIEVLLKTGVIVVGNSGREMPNSSSRSAPRRMLKGHTNIGTLSELCRAHEIEYCDMMEEMLRFIKQTAADDTRLPADPAELGLLPAERFTQLEIPVSDFQEADIFQIHRACSTRTKAFRNGGRFHQASGHIRVGKWSTGRDMGIVGIGEVIGQAHEIPSGERQLIVNHRIDLRTFNDIY